MLSGAQQSVEARLVISKIHTDKRFTFFSQKCEIDFRSTIIADSFGPNHGSI
ncbi:hypothetical protein SAMN04488134_10855 [Amphibacillus marinus]|uniref:Uncharacterized protein n=1 Tax=Amphibacillus marinus TaxID=872970 RepID=A0A1H8Q5Y7_9BACI|nr:hypothetical protein SAMN04488134_10855 [Amphibacillus marinus]